MININVREFELLSSELKSAVVYLRNCRTDVRNSDLFDFIDKAIVIGMNYSKIIEDFIQIEKNNSDLNRYKVVIKNNCDLAKAYIAEINRVKSVAQA